MAAATTLVPALGWLRSYERGWLRYGVMAGVTLAAYLIPAAIGDASLAGLPAQAGLYACRFPALVYWMFSGARHTAITVTSAISLLLLALGAANLAAGLGWGFPVSGGMSQSLVNESGGARTPLSTLVAGSIVLVVTLFLSGMLAELPQPVLAAIVLMALTGLVKLATLRRLWRTHRSEFLVAMAAFAGVLGSGILRGVLIGSILSLLVLMHRAARPHVAFLGRIPRTDHFSDMDRHPDNEPVPGALLFRVDSGIVYFSAEAVRDAVWARADASQEAIRLAVCDLSAAPLVDMAGAEMIAGLARDFAARGIAFRVVRARSSVRDLLRLEGLEQLLGPISRRATLAQTVEDFFSEDVERVR